MNKLTGPPPTLVAHRGYSGNYPENTLLSFRKAYAVGARYMELDLQLTSEAIPVLHHDTSLIRMAGVDLDIRDTTVQEFKSLRAPYRERFGDAFSDNTFTTFRQFCGWLKRHPNVTTFVEIKQESIDRFGVPVFADEVLKRILGADVESQCVMISFNHRVVEYTREISSMRAGWVLPAWTDSNRAMLSALKPDFLFCDKKILPESNKSIWQGNWQWAIYNLDDVASAIAMANRGMPFLETNQIGTLMGNDALAKQHGNNSRQ